MNTIYYEIQVRGLLGPATLNAFPALVSDRVGGDTVLSGTLADQAALYGVLHQIEALGLDLVEVRGQPPRMRLEGLHHVTAVTADARRNVDFYTRVLGLRLLAKSVNQDDPSTYHLFYGDELARPGSHLSFFEHPHAKPGRPGAGMVQRVVWRVGAPSALEFWRRRLTREGIRTDRTDDSLRFADPEGLVHELVDEGSTDEALIAVHPEVSAENAIIGFAGVHVFTSDQPGTAGLLEGLLDAQPRPRSRWELRGSHRGSWIQLQDAPPERGRQGAGTVHHVAWSTTDAEQGRWLARLEEAGVPNSGIIDRYAFHSLYFREPGGALFELATEEPGFTTDTPVKDLGLRVILPPWLESHRSEIETRLTPLPNPRASWLLASEPTSQT